MKNTAEFFTIFLGKPNEEIQTENKTFKHVHSVRKERNCLLD